MTVLFLIGGAVAIGYWLGNTSAGDQLIRQVADMLGSAPAGGTTRAVAHVPREPQLTTRGGAGAGLTIEEHEIARDARISVAVQDQKAALATRGNEILGQLYVQMNDEFRTATGVTIAANNRIQAEQQHRECEAFRRQSTQELGLSLIQNFRQAEAHLVSTTAAPTPSHPLPPPPQTIIEVRKLSIPERIYGTTIIEYETWKTPS